MIEISVVICTHNPRRNYLRRVLDALRNQNLPKDRWELLLVDNASDVRLACEWDLSWHPNVRHFVETELGLSSARRRGIRETRADLLVFVDDDNVLDHDYLTEAIRIKNEWPLLGVWGSGATVPEFESVPLDHLKTLLRYLALRESDRICWGNVPSCVESMPWGAGLCVRTSVAAEYFRSYDESRLRLSDRRGKSLISGGDVEICIVACNAGFGMGVFPQLRLTHLIPKERIEEGYLLQLVEGSLISTMLLNFKWNGNAPETKVSVRSMLSVLKAIVLQRGLDRKLYLVNLRAAIKARRIIDASRKSADSSADEVVSLQSVR
jgi:glycosyltransferase involved in cell wall biosynthesis